MNKSDGHKDCLVYSNKKTRVHESKGIHDRKVQAIIALKWETSRPQNSPC